MEKFNLSKMENLNKINKLLKIFFHEKKIKKNIEWSRIERVLVVDMTLIGDTVMLVPFLEELKKNAPVAQIDLVCGKWGNILLGEQGLVNRFYHMTGDKLETPSKMMRNFKAIYKTLKEIRKTKYDVIIEPRGDVRYIFFMHWCKGKRKISYNYTGGECLLTDVVQPNYDLEHLVDDKLYLLSQIGCKVSGNRAPRLHKTGSFDEFKKQYFERHELDGKIILGNHPGASIAIKQWDKYPELLKRISEGDKEKLYVIVFSGPGEEVIAQSVYESAASSGVKVSLSKTGLEEYIKLLALCDCVICNDSGAGHIAAAYGAEVICIMGPFCPEFCAPISERVYPLSVDVKCKPCLSKECKMQSMECIKAISVEDVLSVWKNTQCVNDVYKEDL